MTDAPGDAPTQRYWRWLALAWTLVVAAVAAHQFVFWRAARLDTDVLALLPDDEQVPAVSAATRKLADQAARQIVVLVGAPNWAAAKSAATVVQAEFTKAADIVTPAVADTRAFDAAVAFYRPWRDRLLTAEQRQWLMQASAEQVAGAALMHLYQPAAGPRFTDWQADPLELWPAWWAARAAETRARPRDELLWLRGDGRDWVLLNYQRVGPAFAVGGSTPLADLLRAARSAAAPGGVVLAAGVPLHAEANAAQANREISTIGWGSLAAVLLLVWLTFRSLRPIVLVALSLLIGCAAALSATALVFGRVHLLTLVFGASLVGVAEDYGFHYFAARQGRPVAARWSILRRLLPGLLLALVTSALAYLALGLAPFPGLRQMAVFSAVGLSAAFLTVVCWFPLFDRRELPATRFAAWFAASLPHWQRWRPDRQGWWLAAAALVFCVTGLMRIEPRDDLRELQSSPESLIAEQRSVSRLLGLPSPAQFYLVEGANPVEVLRREEALKLRLDALVAAKVLPGYRAVSDWLPSPERQQADAVLTAAAERSALAAIAAQTGERAERPAFAAAPLGFDAWLAGPASQAVRAQWLGTMAGKQFSVILLQGITPALLPSLADAGRDLDGVRWVDRTAEFSRLLARYRGVMGELLVAGYVAVLAALLWRFRMLAWRALLPTALGSLMTVAAFGWIGVPLQLFVVLALVLLLGMGVDYGIFLLEHPGDGAAWLAVALAGVSTILSFGLLALSATPALRAFGLTMLLGELSIWLLTPCFRPPDPQSSPT